MSRETVPLRLEGTEKMVLPSSPSNATRWCGFVFSADSWCRGDDALWFLTHTSSVVVLCQPWFYQRLFAYEIGSVGYRTVQEPRRSYTYSRGFQNSASVTLGNHCNSRNNRSELRPSPHSSNC